MSTPPDVAALLALADTAENGLRILERNAYADTVNALANALRAALADQRRQCHWHYMDWPASVSDFETECSQAWSFADGGITENGVVFCCHCGGKVIAPGIPNSCIDCGDEISATAERCTDCDAAMTADGGGV